MRQLERSAVGEGGVCLRCGWVSGGRVGLAALSGCGWCTQLSPETCRHPMLAHHASWLRPCGKGHCHVASMIHLSSSHPKQRKQRKGRRFHVGVAARARSSEMLWFGSTVQTGG